MTIDTPVLAEVTRGTIVESRHRGVIIIAEASGESIAEIGDASLITSTRSAIKPIQAIPIITSGAADHFKLTQGEIAIACASHEGERIHTETVIRMLKRASLTEAALRCGGHAPYNIETAQQLEREAAPYTQLHNNCSGKHAGMLLTAAHLGLSTDDYYKPDHPIQRQVISLLSALGGLDHEPAVAIDGCSAPTFGVPLKSLAVAFARLIWNDSGSEDGWAGPDKLPARFSEAARRVTSAMIEYPEMVGGSNRFDTDLLRAARGKLICKVGAEAVYAIGVLPASRFPRGLGIAIKIEDGAYRALGSVVVETLAQLRILDASELAELEKYHRPAIDNRRGLKVGEVRPVFDLEFDKI
ncbi:MAG TPA: asparaginase [Blastocatellia bacterium]